MKSIYAISSQPCPVCGAEAYTGDINRPLKRLVPLVSAVETGILRIIARRYDLEWPMPAAVKAADMRVLGAEAHALMTPLAREWSVAVEPIAGLEIQPWSAEYAEAIFAQAVWGEIRRRALPQKSGVCQ